MKTIFAALVAVSTIAAMAVPASAGPSPWAKYGATSGSETR